MTSKYPVSNSKNVVLLVEMRTLPFTFWINRPKNETHGNQKWPKLNTLETKMVKISPFTVFKFLLKVLLMSTGSTTNNSFALVLIIAFTGKQSYYNSQYMYLFTQQFYIINRSKVTKKFIWQITPL
jgi:hypothetical protein